MSSAKFENIARLMMTYNFQIDDLPNNLKCAKCKLVLKDAYLLSCECSFCRICIDNMTANGVQFCPGISKYCGKSSLSCLVSDFRANNSISRLTVKCPLNKCVHECQLGNMEDHLRECQRKSEECPFCELGCMQNKLKREEMNGHLQQENRGHSEILIATVTTIKREVEILKQELVMKDDQIKMLNDQIIHLENENKIIMQDKKRLSQRVSIVFEKIQRGIDERRQSDEQESARVLEHVNTEIATIKRAIDSNKDTLATEMRSIRDDFRSMYPGDQSVKEDTCSTKSELQSTQVPEEQVDAKFNLITNEDISKITWSESAENRVYFTGTVHPYKYKLLSCNGDSSASLRIYLRIYCGPNDDQLAWPFRGRVIVTVAEKDRPEPCRSISRQCSIERPPQNFYKISDKFDFPHSELIAAGLNLSGGVSISCVIIHNADG